MRMSRNIGNSVTEALMFRLMLINIWLFYITFFTPVTVANAFFPLPHYNAPYQNQPSLPHDFDTMHLGSPQQESRLERFQCSQFWPIRQKMNMSQRSEFQARKTNDDRAGNVFRQMVEREKDAIELLKQEILRGLRSRIESSNALAQEELAEAKERGVQLTKYVGPKGTTLHFRKDEQSEVEQNEAPEPLEDYTLLKHVDE